MVLNEIAAQVTAAEAEPAQSRASSETGKGLSAIPAWAQRSLGVDGRHIPVEHHVVEASGQGAASSSGIQLTGRVTDDLVVHEVAHVRQHDNRVRGAFPDVESAEAEATALADAQRTGRPLWVPRTALPSGHIAHNGGPKGADPQGPPSSASTATRPRSTRLSPCWKVSPTRASAGVR